MPRSIRSRPRRSPSASSRSSAKMTFGSPAQVMHGTALKTVGGVTRAGLMKTRDGRIVSRKKHEHGKKMYRKYKAIMDAYRAAPFS